MQIIHTRINIAMRLLAGPIVALLVASACGTTPPEGSAKDDTSDTTANDNTAPTDTTTENTARTNTAPNTTINSGPSGTVSDPDATLTFSCDESSCTFECQLDGAGWLSCTSPKTYTGLINGTYTFEVRAIDVSDTVDSTPATQEWTIYSIVETYGPQWDIPDTGISLCYDATTTIVCPSSGQNYYGQDAQYSANAMSFTNNGNGTVTDNITGLIWQREDDNNTHTWDNAVSVCDGLSLGGSNAWRLPNPFELESIVDFSTYNPAINSSMFPATNSDVYWSSSPHSYDSSKVWIVHFYHGYTSAHGYKTGAGYVRCVR